MDQQQKHKRTSPIGLTNISKKLFAKFPYKILYKRVTATWFLHLVFEEKVTIQEILASIMIGWE